MYWWYDTCSNDEGHHYPQDNPAQNKDLQTTLLYARNDIEKHGDTVQGTLVVSNSVQKISNTYGLSEVSKAKVYC